MDTTVIYNSTPMKVLRCEPEQPIETTFSDEPTETPVYQVFRSDEFQFSISIADIKAINSENETKSQIVPATNERCPVCNSYMNTETTIIETDISLTIHTDCRLLLHNLSLLLSEYDSSTLYVHLI